MAAQGEFNHPYSPRDLKLPGYVPLLLAESTRSGVYAIALLLVVSLMWIISGRVHKISKTDRLLMCWLMVSGLAHIIIEGYYVVSPEFYKEKTPHYLAEAWKEYSKADSRFAGRDSVIVAVIGIVAFCHGPASLFAVYAIATKRSYSYILQAAISLAEIYSTFVIFITAFLDGNNFAVSSYYFYFYFIGANGLWVLIPTIIAIRSWMKICAAFQVQESKRAKTR